MPRALWLLWSLGLVHGAACTFPSVEGPYHGCPCDDGQVCDTADNRCTEAFDSQQPQQHQRPPDDAGTTADASLDCDPENDAGEPCYDECPDNPDKLEPGHCGCSVSDDDGDADGTPDCIDECPADPNKSAAGTCGCGRAEPDPFTDEGAVAPDSMCRCPSGMQYLEGECTAVCGDGLIAPAELCDDGNDNDSDDCTNACQPARCGDGIVWDKQSGRETCDDGNENPEDGCVACRVARCGDGWVQAGVEECDGNGEGNGRSTGACSKACTWRSCGDGVVETKAGEYCDDGNVEAGDGCAPDCHGEGRQLGAESESPHIDDSTKNTRNMQGLCGPNAVAIGLFGRSGGWFDHFGVRCQPIDDGFRLTGSPFNADQIGSRSGGSPFDPLLCPDGEFLVAITATHDTRFRALRGHCRPGSTVSAGSSNESGTSRTDVQDTGLARDYAVTDTVACPSGSVVTGFIGAESEDGSASKVLLQCKSMTP